MDNNVLTTVITAALGGGGAVALFGLLKSVFDHFTGKVDRERTYHKETLQGYKNAVREAEAEADRERKLRIEAERDTVRAEEKLSYLRRVAIEHGIPITDVFKIIHERKDSDD